MDENDCYTFDTCMMPMVDLGTGERGFIFHAFIFPLRNLSFKRLKSF